MLRARLIPSLLIHKGGLVKTVNFKNPKYVGDPINAIKIFNEKLADELIIMDIDASVKNVEPDYKLISNFATESRMPLCYGGGIKNLEQAQKIISLGVEKVAISSLALERPEEIPKIVSSIGSQSLVVVIDVKKNKIFSGYSIYSHNGSKKYKTSLDKFIEELMIYGVGEIVINSIDNDGVMEGFDIFLAKHIKSLITTPMTMLGGAGSLNHVSELLDEVGLIGVSCGSLFVFKGQYKAVLITYPEYNKKIDITSNI